MCVLKFKNYWFKKFDSRKVNSPFFRARAECKFENCRFYTFYIDNEFNSFRNGIVVKFHSEGSLSPQHTDSNIAHRRHLSGSERSKMAGSFVNNSVNQVFNKQFNNHCSMDGFPFGKLTYLKSAECLRKVKSEIKFESRFSNCYMEDVAATQQYFRYLLPDSPMPGYIQYFVQDPFIIHMYSHKQIELLKLLDRKGIVLNLDATGSLISKPPSCPKKIYYYALKIQHPEFSTSPVPLAEMISSDHSTAEISHFLNKWFLSIKLFNKNELKINKVEIDFSWACIHSTCLAFNKFTILSYLQNCREFIYDNGKIDVSTTVLHLCSAHIMHRISYNLEKKFKIDKQIKRIVLHVFDRMVNCKHMDEINQLFGLLCYILCSKKQTSVYFDKLNQLEKCVKGEINVSINVPEEFEDESDNHLNGVTYREKSPFGRHFDLVYQRTLVSLSQVDDISQYDPNSVSYNPKIIEFLLTHYFPLLPLWSGIILSSINSEEISTDSNAIVENWFRIVKHSIFNSETLMQAGDSIRTLYKNIDDRIAAFKFAFTPLAHKVFKSKKRVSVENEEECKEEWSRSKRSKLSYTKPTIDKVKTVFASLKSSKNIMNVEESSNSRVTDLVMSVEEAVDDNDKKNILKVEEIEIITDLDIVEVATLEYKLPGYRPLTYRGQRKLCEEFELRFLDSTNSIRDNIAGVSNLREYVPSKMLPTPGDGNCLFASLSYWVTGNMDHVNI